MLRFGPPRSEGVAGDGSRQAPPLRPGPGRCQRCCVKQQRKRTCSLCHFGKFLNTVQRFFGHSGGWVTKKGGPKVPWLFSCERSERKDWIENSTPSGNAPLCSKKPHGQQRANRETRLSEKCDHSLRGVLGAAAFAFATSLVNTPLMCTLCRWTRWSTRLGGVAEDRL